VQETLGVARAAQLQVDWLEINALLERSLRSALGSVPEGRIAVDRKFSPQALLVRGDETLLEQVFTNILRNAVEAMPGGGAVRLETGARLMRGREEITVSVRDSGPGIPPHLAERLFQPFYTTKEDGTGLGLVLSRKYARAHGGDLEVRAGPGGGTEIVVTLPVAGPAAAVGEA
jgi:signal transduction histidine kinase